jgi:hypothetical protein
METRHNTSRDMKMRRRTQYEDGARDVVHGRDVGCDTKARPKTKIRHKAQYKGRTRDTIQRWGTRCDTKAGRSVEARHDAEAERSAKARHGRGETRQRRDAMQR